MNYITLDSGERIPALSPGQVNQRKLDVFIQARRKFDSPES